MKKNRPAVKITVICREEDGDSIASLLLSESGTLGVRISQVRRLKAQRVFERIETPIGSMSIKVKRLGDRVISATPEFDECQRLAHERNLPLEEVYEVARQAIKKTLR